MFGHHPHTHGFICSIAGCVIGQSHNSKKLSHPRSDNRSKIHVYFLNRHHLLRIFNMVTVFPLIQANCLEYRLGLRYNTGRGVYFRNSCISADNYSIYCGMHVRAYRQRADSTTNNELCYHQEHSTSPCSVQHTAVTLHQLTKTDKLKMRM